MSLPLSMTSLANIFASTSEAEPVLMLDLFLNPLTFDVARDVVMDFYLTSLNSFA
jgi:hypothetical protein